MLLITIVLLLDIIAIGIKIYTDDDCWWY